MKFTNKDVVEVQITTFFPFPLETTHFFLDKILEVG